MDGNGAEENPGTLAAQGVELGRHWVDMGAGGAWPGAPLFLKKEKLPNHKKVVRELGGALKKAGAIDFPTLRQYETLRSVLVYSRLRQPGHVSFSSDCIYKSIASATALEWTTASTTVRAP